MIKLPKQVKDIIKKLRDNGYEAFAVGACVRNSLAGQKPLDWDVATNAGADALKELFPEGKVLSEKYSVIRLRNPESDEDIITDVGTYRRKAASEGESLFCTAVQEDLRRRDFTVNAMADSGYDFIDDFGGRNDVQAKLVRTIDDADGIFRAEPVKMLRALRITAELGYDLTKDVYEAIKRNHALVRELSPDRLRKEFMQIMGGEFAGKALNMMLDMGLLTDILGEEATGRLTRREQSDLMILCENIDKTKRIPERRMGALISILSSRKGLSIIDRLGFEGKVRQNLEDVAKDLPAFHFAQQPHTFKKFIYEHAPMERTDYLLNLQKALLIIFDYSIETKIKSKMYLLKEFEKNSEPIFVEDLAIDANDLMEAGILDSPEECDRMLHMLAERLHLEPKKNTRAELFALAKTYKKSKLKAYLRGISWMH